MTNINGKRHADILAYFLHLHYIPFNGNGEENPLRFALSGNASYFPNKAAGVTVLPGRVSPKLSTAHSPGIFILFFRASFLNVAIDRKNSFNGRAGYPAYMAPSGTSPVTPETPPI